MFTAIVVTKLIYSVVISRGWIKELKMLSIIKGATNIDFLGKRNIAIAVSLVVILGSWGNLLYKTYRNSSSTLGVDFVGGAAMTYTSSQPLSEDGIRKALDEAGIRVANVQQQREFEGSGAKSVLVNTSLDKVNGKDPSEAATEVLQKTFPGADVRLLQEEKVGPQIGKELKYQALLAVLLSFVGMIVYISWRFEFGFALGAIVALFHDVLITAGVFVLLGHQLTMQTVAVLLTIIGFSINDTIVIFDRIREDVRVVKNKTFTEICNQSVNSTLARTILTTLTVFITVVMLLVFGGGAINEFALALFIGLIAGTYSTVFIATPVVLAWHKGKTPDLGKHPSAAK
jgi:preprotein translocase SecF subunit